MKGPIGADFEISGFWLPSAVLLPILAAVAGGHWLISESS